MSGKTVSDTLGNRIRKLENELNQLREQASLPPSPTYIQTIAVKKIEEDLLDCMVDGITILDEKSNILFINRSAEKQFVCDRNDVIGRNLKEIVTAVDGQKDFATIVQKAFLKRQYISGESRVKAFNGVELDLYISFSVKDSNTDPSNRMIIVHRDITDEKAIRSDLKNSEERLNTLIETFPDVILNLDFEGNILYINHSTAEIRREEYIGKKVFDFTFPEDHEEIRNTLNRVFETGKGGGYETRMIAHDGIVRWYATKVAPIKHDQEVVAVTLCARDNSAKHQAEEELKRSKEMLESVFNAIPGTILVLDRKLRVIASNWRGLKEFKLEKFAKKKRCFQVAWNNEESCENCEAKEVFRTGKPHVREHFNQEDKKYKEIRLYPICNDKGKVVYVVEHIQDITLHKQSELKMFLADQKTEAANQMKSDFLSKISHELRTPMVGVLSFAKLGIDRIHSVDKTKLKSYFATIKESGDKLQSLLNNLIDLSQLEVGTATYDYQKASLSMIVTIIINELFLQLKEKSVQVVFQKPSFPDQVIMDVDKIGKVIRNLMLNAIKFSTPGSEIKVEITAVEGHLQFAVTDMGEGIDSKDLKLIFEKFNQGKNLKDNSGNGGTGLGLAISRKIINDHHGKIWAENDLLKGSTFKFLLPTEEEETRN